MAFTFGKFGGMRRRRGRRVPTGGRRVNFRQTKAIVNLQKKVKQITRAEPKYSNVNISESTLVNGTPKSHLLNGMSQGDDNLSRDGTRLRWKWIDLRGYTKSTTSLTGHTLIRFVLIQHKCAEGVALSTILDDVFVKSEVADGTPDGLSMYNYIQGDWSANFRVLWDSGAMVMGPNRIDYTSMAGHTTAHPHERVLRFKKRINIQTVYGLSNSGGVGDIDKNAIHLVAFSDTTTASALEYHFQSFMMGTEN